MTLSNKFKVRVPVQDLEGNAIPHATVTVYSSGNITAPIYDDDGDPISNPVSTNSEGWAEFKIDNGLYDILVAYGSYTQRSNGFVASSAFDEADEAREWAIKTDGPVETDPADEWSAKAHASSTNGDAPDTGSAKQWAITAEDTVVADGEYSAKHYAAKAAEELDRLTATSTSSVEIGTGEKTFTTQAGKVFEQGAYVVISSDANPGTNRMFGTVTSYTTTTLVVEVEVSDGSGTLDDWAIQFSGARGATGAAGAAGTPIGVTGYIYMGTQIITATGTYTPTAGATHRIEEAQAGGGGGGGSVGAGTGQANAGGGGGGGKVTTFSAIEAVSYTVTIGAAGAAGASGNNNGTAGGNTTVSGTNFSSTATGGGLGVGGANTTTNQQRDGGQGGGGSSSGSSIIWEKIEYGHDGGNGRVIGGVGLRMSSGGNSPLGRGGRKQTGGGVAGVAGTGYGAGGSGADASTVSTAGGAGRPGVVIIHEYIEVT